MRLIASLCTERRNLLYGDFNSLCFSRFYAVVVYILKNKNAHSEKKLPYCVQVTLAVSRLIDCSASAAVS